MKFTTKPYKIPARGDTRIIKKFVFFPRRRTFWEMDQKEKLTYRDEYTWLEYCYVQQIMSKSSWEFECYASKEEYDSFMCGAQYPFCR